MGKHLMKIFIDIDDVLAETFGAIENRFGKAADPSLEDLTVMFPGADVNSIIESVEFYMEIPPIKGAVLGVNWLLEKGHNASYLSSRPSSVEEATQEWLKIYNFPNLPMQCLGRDSKKEVLGSSDYDLLIDDQVRYLDAAQDNGRMVIAMANPWNSSWGGVRVEGWNGLRDFFQRLPNA